MHIYAAQSRVAHRSPHKFLIGFFVFRIFHLVRPHFFCLIKTNQQKMLGPTAS
jgi:hypothetical protein